MLRWLKTVVVSDEEKAPVRRRQVGIGKASESDSLMTCRNLATGIETGVSMQSRDESGGNPFTGQVVSGIQATRARSAAFTWNVGGLAPILPPHGVARGSARKRRNLRGAEYRRGVGIRTDS